MAQLTAKYGNAITVTTKTNVYRIKLMDSKDRFPNRSGFLVIDWITGEDEWEEIGAIDYWQASAVVDALKKHKAELYGQLTYYKAKVEKGKKSEDDGIYVLEQRYKSAEEMSELMFNVVRKMREYYKQNETD